MSTPEWPVTERNGIASARPSSSNEKGRKSGDERTFDEAPSPPSPRAFAVGTGVVFQTVGVIFALSAFCAWSLSGHIVPKAPRPESEWTHYLAGDRLPAAAFTVGVVTTLLAGLGMVAAGVGLQGERPTSGWIAVIVTALAAAFYWTLGIILVVEVDSWLSALVPGMFAVITTILVLFAWRSALLLKRFPPPPDQSRVTDEMLESYRRKRH